MNCSKCGKNLLEEAKFCYFCGEPVVYEDEENKLDDTYEQRLLKDVMHQEFTKEVYDEDKDDYIKVKKFLDYNVEAGILTISYGDGNILFSEKCDAPKLSEGRELVPTYYYINEFNEDFDFNYIIFKKDRWKIYNLADKEYMTIKKYAEDEDSEIITELDSFDEVYSYVYKLSFQDNYGLIKFVYKDTINIEGDTKYIWDFIQLTDCKYSSIYWKSGGCYGATTDYYDVDLIDINIGVIKSIKNLKLDEVYVCDTDDYYHIAFEDKYLIYDKYKLEKTYNGQILYYDHEIEPAEEYKIEKKIGSLFICTNNKYDLKKYGAFWGYKLTLDFKYDDIEVVYEDGNDVCLLKILKSGHWGICDHTGKILIPNRFIDIQLYKIKGSNTVFISSNYEKKYLYNFDYNGIYDGNVEWKTTYKDVTDTYEDTYWFFDEDDFINVTNKNLVFDIEDLVIRKKDEFSNEDYFDEEDEDIDMITNFLDPNTDLTQNFDNKLCKENLIFEENTALYKDNYESWHFYNPKDQSSEYYYFGGQDIDSTELRAFGNILIFRKDNLFGIYYYDNKTKKIKQLTDFKYHKIVKHENGENIVLLGYFNEFTEDDIIKIECLDIIGKDGVKFSIDSLPIPKSSVVHHLKSINNKLYIAFWDNNKNEYSKLFIIKDKNTIEDEYTIIFSDKNKFIAFNSENQIAFITNDYDVKQIGKLIKNNNNYIICKKDGLVGILNNVGEILVPFNYSSIIEIKRNFLELNYFGKKGIALLSDSDIQYVIPCEYETINNLIGSEISEDDKSNGLVKIESLKYYFRVVKMGRLAYYDLNGKLVIHFRMITPQDKI